MRISDWSSDVCSSDLHAGGPFQVSMPAGAGSVLRQRRGACGPGTRGGLRRSPDRCGDVPGDATAAALGHGVRGPAYRPCGHPRSEEHTSELQSLMRISYAVFCLKNKNKQTIK